MNIVPQARAENQVFETSRRFCRDFRIGAGLKRANIQKVNGHSCLSVFQFAFGLVFSGRNLWRYLEKETALFEKDTVYRMLNNPRRMPGWMLLDQPRFPRPCHDLGAVPRRQFAEDALQMPLGRVR